MSAVSPTRDLALVIDLDGTLIRTDLLYESLLSAARRAPWALLRLPIWLLRGKAYLKARLAELAVIDPALLPLEPRVLEALRAHNSRQKVLCTASDDRLARQVAEHVGGFDEVLASNGSINLSGRRKAEALVARFGDKGFIYAGNARVDLDVWRHAAAAWVVAEPALARSAAGQTLVERHWPGPARGPRAWVRALRLHQWLKNLLVFVPLLAAHQWLDAGRALDAVLAFFAFGLCASAVYITNDLFDVASDRAHPTKRKRPFASGQLPLVSGITAAPCLALLALALAVSIGPAFAAWLLAYLALTSAYTFSLKSKPVADVMTLASLYTLRVLAGAAAVAVPVSSWLLAFSVFVFLSLALVKRYAELFELRARGGLAAAGRGYHIDDLPLIASLGASSGYVAALVLALYADAAAQDGLYADPQYLWALCLILLAWISRVWLLAHRGEMHEDPVVFAVRDRASWGLVAAGAAFVALAL